MVDKDWPSGKSKQSLANLSLVSGILNSKTYLSMCALF